jgi:hypothetical protein
LDRVGFYQKKFPRYLTVAYARDTEPESEIDSLKMKMNEATSMVEQIKLETFQLKMNQLEGMK